MITPHKRCSRQECFWFRACDCASCRNSRIQSWSAISVHVAAYVEQLGRTHSKPTVKQDLAAIRMLFDWLVTGHIMESNPADAVRGPKHSVRKGKTSVLSAEEMHELLAAIDTTSLLGLRDRALIALMGYTVARVGAAIGMKVEDFQVQKRRVWVRLYEKGGKVTELGWGWPTNLPVVAESRCRGCTGRAPDPGFRTKLTSSGGQRNR